ncbi:uncharacterized protein LOC142230775 [Haematobia irritans]|uniref:uncharacterized protein LOC142230775 n=1 Tax=Haematobia irritans TaxID=7368 RepID=UPI003F5078E5
MSSDIAMIIMCRTCLDGSGKYKLNDCIEDGNKIVEMLNAVVPQIHINDGNQFSVYICQICLEKLLTAYRFQCLCIETNIQLQKFHDKSNPEQKLCTDPLMDLEQCLELKDESVKIKSDNEYGVHNDNAGNDDEDNGNDSDSSNEKLSVLRDRRRFHTTGIPAKSERNINKLDKKDNPNHLDDKSASKRKNSGKSRKIHRRLNTESMSAIVHCSEKLELSENNCNNPLESITSNNGILNLMNNKNSSEESFMASDNIKQNDDGDMEPREKLNSDSYPCDICDMVFDKPFRLKRHQRQHSTERLPYECEICKRDFFSANPLIKHMKKYHPQAEKHSCDQCNESFILRNHLEKHLKKHHRNSRNLYCKICDKDFKFKSSLEKHLRSHSDERPYLCAQCGKTFRSSSNLSEHVTRHSGLPTYACPECPRRFKCGSDLRKHSTTHSNSKPHVCDICGFRFTRAYSLLEHKRLHTGEKPFKCDQCSKSFAIIYHLKRHTRIHTGEKPYRCKYCDRAYAVGGDLTKHLRVHLGEKTYLCTECPMAFKYNSELQKHLIEHYKKQQNQLKGPNGQEDPKRDYVTFNMFPQTATIFKCLTTLCNSLCLLKAFMVEHPRRQISQMSLDLASICRTCMSKGRRYYLLDDVLDENYTILEMLNDVVPQIKIQEDIDIELSSLLCEACVDKLSISFAFHQLCINTDRRLRKMILYPIEESLFDDSNGSFDALLEEDDSVTCVNLSKYSNSSSDNDSTQMNIFEEEHLVENLIIDEQNESDGEDIVESLAMDGEVLVTSLQITKIGKGHCEEEIRQLEDSIEDINQIPLENIRILEDCSKDILPIKKQLNNPKKMDVFPEYDEIEDNGEDHSISKSETSLYQGNRNTYGTNRQFPCKVCGKVFNAIYRLQRHTPVHASNKPYVCDICQRGCSNLNSLRGHKLLHTREENEENPPENYKCPFCPKYFPSKNSLSSHRSTHSSVNSKYSCKFCKRKYMTMKTLTDHSRKIHPDHTYSCELCDKKFVQHEQLLRHLNTHREIELSCTICNKVFTSEYTLKEHKNIHTGENPYLCPTCGKGFKYSSSLRRHIERHNIENKYRCPFCDRNFKCREDVNVHKKMHISDSFKCTICGHRFNKKHQLKSHRKLHKQSVKNNGTRTYRRNSSCLLFIIQIILFIMLSIELYGRICRACMNKRIPLYNLQEFCLGLKLDEMIKSIFHDTKYEFPLPNEICESCLEKLKVAYKFQEMCRNTCKILYNTWILSQQVREIPIPNEALEQVDNQDDPLLDEVETKTEHQSKNPINLEGNKQDDYEEHEEKNCEKTFESNELIIFSGTKMDEDDDNIPLSLLRKKNTKEELIKLTDEMTIAPIRKFSQESPISKIQHKCDLCAKEYSSATMLQKHKRSKHKDIGVSIKSKTKRATVLKNSQPVVLMDMEAPSNDDEISNKSYVCSQNSDDEKSHDEKQTNSNNTKNKVTSENFPCKECKATFRFEKQLERHIKKHTENHRFVCIVCNDRFKYPFMLQKHTEKHHQSEKVKIIDMKKDTLDKPHACKYCTSAYTNIGGLAQHMSKKHPEIIPFKCEKCEKTFVVEEHLKIHTNRHLGIKNFKCELCDKSFSFKFAMKQHMRIHTGNLNYLCTICGKKFYRPSNLRQHMQRHGDEKSYSCPNCPKRFKCPSDRYIHLMSHQKEKNHVCSTCGARFSRVDTLHQHQILHTGQKPYKCDQCPMAFPRLMNLTRHLRTHSGEKPYECKHCGKSYAQSNDLNKHLRTHVGENTYICTKPQCSAAFKYQADLRNHEWEHYRKQKEDELREKETSTDSLVKCNN